MDSSLQGAGLYLAKRGSDNITFAFVANWTNLFLKYSLPHAEGGMESSVPESVSLQHTSMTSLFIQYRETKIIQM